MTKLEEIKILICYEKETSFYQHDFISNERRLVLALNDYDVWRELLLKTYSYALQEEDVPKEERKRILKKEWKRLCTQEELIIRNEKEFNAA